MSYDLDLNNTGVSFMSKSGTFLASTYADFDHCMNEC